MARIVIVDDDPLIVGLVRETLAGHEVLDANNGVDGLALVQAQKPDLVILDVTMPRLSGTTVCARIKNDPAIARIPVIMLTGWGTVGDIDEGFANKANDYVVKPFVPRALKAKVEGLLAGGAGATPPPPGAKPA